MHGIPLWVEVVVYVLYHLPWFIGGAVVVGLAVWWWRRRIRNAAINGGQDDG